MFKYGVNCALEEVPFQNPVILRGSIEEIASTAAEIGYDGLELFIREPLQYNPEQLNRAARNNGLGFASIASGMEYTKNGLCLISEDASVRKQAVQRLYEHIDLAKELNCSVIVGIMRGNIPNFEKQDYYLALLDECFLQLSEYAAKKGVLLVVEAIMRYINNYLNSIPDTIQYLDHLNLANVQIHIDSHHMNVEDLDTDKAIQLCRGKMGYVHFSDSNRTYPGGGEYDFKKLMNALMDIDYTGYVTTECQPFPTPYDCAKRGLNYMKALENALMVERACFKPSL
ncbi:MAG: sugar phosphate isomerase/epimerase family protein [Oscillospiraceae bacterium]